MPPEPEDDLPPTVVGRDGETYFTVWPDNWRPFLAYMELLTQWRLDNNGVRYGLIYSELRAYAADIEPDPAKRQQLQADVKVMERAAIPEYRQNAIDDLKEQQEKLKAQTRR